MYNVPAVIEILEDLLISIQNHRKGCTDQLEIHRFDMREYSLRIAIEKLKGDSDDNTIKNDPRKKYKKKKG